MTNCLNYVNGFTGTKCLIINEASSSKTAFFSYNSTFGVNTIMVNGKPKQKYSLSDPQNPNKYAADSYALGGDIQGYYTIIRGDSVINNHIISSGCSIFYWALLATGGMRNLEDTEGLEVVNKFYSGLQYLFSSNPNVCVGAICKPVILLRAETITGAEEGQYAWLTLQTIQNTNCHAVIDLGGQTGQFANQSYAFSGYLGKDRAIGKIQSASVSDDDADDDLQYYDWSITQCYNDNSQYNGIQCRGNISSYISTIFGNELPSIDYSQYCSFYTISNFYNYFNDICNSYLPYVANNNLPINPSTLSQIQSICLVKSQSNQPLIMGINGYQNITDEVCAYWNSKWTGNTANYAKDACFSGNYNYGILKAFGLSDDQLLHIQFIGDEVAVDQADWALGAAVDTATNCNNAPTPTPNPFEKYDNQISHLTTMFNALTAVTTVIVTGLLVYTCWRHGKVNAMQAAALSKLSKIDKIDGLIKDLATRHSELGIKVEDLGASVEELSGRMASYQSAAEEGRHPLLAGHAHVGHHYGT
jgi:hypothetical protein